MELGRARSSDGSKEGGNAFVEKRKPRFYELREREAAARAKLVAEYEDATKKK